MWYDGFRDALNLGNTRIEIMEVVSGRDLCIMFIVTAVCQFHGSFLNLLVLNVSQGGKLANYLKWRLAN